MKTASFCAATATLALMTAACAPVDGPRVAGVSNAALADEADFPTINPANWPTANYPIERDGKIEAAIVALVEKMTLEEKVGQVIQADIASVTPQDVRDYHLGSILNGGNSAPGEDIRTTPQAWLELADAFWAASTDTTGGRAAIPVMWGTDAVHGHNNIVGATIFPHNIGLGATRDPALMERIGQVTAREMRVTGQDWTFAPTIAVARNDRWGRTYESYSETPDIVAQYAPYLVYGLQGRPGDADFLTGEHVPATVKHFVGDGGTVDGRDQGENLYSEAELRDLQAAGYPAAIEAGVQSVMASFNSWHGRKMHGFKPLLTDVLRGRYNFDGFVVGDWNGHGQVAGCTSTECAQSLMAGLDLYMAPDSWRGMYDSLLAQVRSGEIPVERLNEAVSRILRTKMRAGLFEAGPPSSRLLAGEFALLGSDAHRAVAREAVRKSLVLLKNSGVLPIRPGARVLITGDGANDLGKQTGGWTLSWQGTGNSRADFPNGSTIWEGLEEAIAAIGGEARLAEYGDSSPADVAIVVFGEDPYAEFQGDRDHVDFQPTEALQELRRLKAAGIPTVSVFLSGRPMWVNPELNQSDAFVAAWLPGSEGAGVADVLVAGADGQPRYDFSGRLSFSWPNSAHDVELNYGDEEYNPLFPWGYGATFSTPTFSKLFDESSELAGGAARDISRVLVAGVPRAPWVLQLSDSGGTIDASVGSGISPRQAVSVIAADDRVQEDMRRVTFADQGRFAVMTEPTDLERESNGEMSMRIEYRVERAGPGTIALGGYCGGTADCEAFIDQTENLRALAGQGWQQATIRLSCLDDAGVYMGRLVSPFALEGSSGWVLGLRDVTLVQNDGSATCEL